MAWREFFGSTPSGLARLEPAFERRTFDSGSSDLDWHDYGWSVPTAAGAHVNQATAMSVTSVYACVSIISHDIAKLGAGVFNGQRRGKRMPAKNHYLYALLQRPTPWLTWFEFCGMMQASVLLRGNGYAVILRDGRGKPTMLVPINPDRVALWEGPNGALFYFVTRSGYHETAVLKDMPLLIPAEDIFHLKSLTANGLLGLSPISLHREAIGLAIAQEQLASRWAGNGANHSGILSTDNKLTKDAAERMAEDWRRNKGGTNNAGKIVVLEQGLKFQQLSMSSQDLEFIASRNFQLEEIARMYRMQLQMLGVPNASKSGNNQITQQAQEYLNFCLSTHIEMWEQRLAFTFDVDGEDMFVDFDEDRLLRADIGTRYAAHRIALGGTGWESINEIREAEGKGPIEGGEQVFRPTNTAPADSDVFQGIADPNDPSVPGSGNPGVGSDQSGQGAEGGGRPPGDGTDAAPQKI